MGPHELCTSPYPLIPQAMHVHNMISNFLVGMMIFGSKIEMSLEANKFS